MRSLLLGGMIALVGPVAVAGAAQEGPPPLDSGRVESGRAIYRQYCASCHGARGEGAPGWREPDERGEFPPPPHGPEGHTWRHADAELYRMIAQGWRDPFNRTERLTMPAFGDLLSPGEIRAVVAYLKTLWTPEQRRSQWEESRGEPFPPEARGPASGGLPETSSEAMD